MPDTKIPNHKTVAEQLDDLMKEDEAARKKQLYRRQIPKETTLAAALDAMTKSELDDIRYNLNVQGASSLKKAELVEKLAPAILAFSERWFPTVIDEEYETFAHLMAHGGRSTELRDDDLRLDYLRGLGLLGQLALIRRFALRLHGGLLGGEDGVGLDGLGLLRLLLFRERLPKKHAYTAEQRDAEQNGENGG